MYWSTLDSFKKPCFDDLYNSELNFASLLFSMNKPVILTVDDDPEVLQAIARDLRRQYGDRYRIMRADSGQFGDRLSLQIPWIIQTV